MPAPEKQGYGRTQKLLLATKLLDGREAASPFTLIVDSLEQSATQLVSECISRAKSFKVSVIHISFASLRPLKGADQFIQASELSASTLAQRVHAVCKGTAPPQSRNLVVIDTVHPLANDSSINIASYLSSFISPTTSLLAVYHSDQPLPSPTQAKSPYAPHPLTLLKFLATTVFTLHSFSRLLSDKRARDRSMAAPAFGLREEGEGVLQGLGSNDLRGCVLEMEHRRKSGRAVGALLFLPRTATPKTAGGTTKKEQLMLLDEHPSFKPPAEEKQPDEREELGQVSFNLGLTEKQRRDREGVVLPYFDAQKEGGAAGEGGRILYEMGVEDDFDEEEDEI